MLWTFGKLTSVKTHFCSGLNSFRRWRTSSSFPSTMAFANRNSGSLGTTSELDLFNGAGGEESLEVVVGTLTYEPGPSLSPFLDVDIAAVAVVDEVICLFTSVLTSVYTVVVVVSSCDELGACLVSSLSSESIRNNMSFVGYLRHDAPSYVLQVPLPLTCSYAKCKCTQIQTR